MMPEKYFFPLKRGSRKVVVVSNDKYLRLDEFYPSPDMKQVVFNFVLLHRYRFLSGEMSCLLHRLHSL